jgi:hypothetical protein
VAVIVVTSDDGFGELIVFYSNEKIFKKNNLEM